MVLPRYFRALSVSLEAAGNSSRGDHAAQVVRLGVHRTFISAYHALVYMFWDVAYEHRWSIWNCGRIGCKARGSILRLQIACYALAKKTIVVASALRFHQIPLISSNLLLISLECCETQGSSIEGYRTLIKFIQTPRGCTSHGDCPPGDRKERGVVSVDLFAIWELRHRRILGHLRTFPSTRWVNSGRFRIVVALEHDWPW